MRVFVIGVLVSGLATATGCGTTFNTFGPRPNPHAYGGVEFDCMALQGTWSAATKEPVANKVLITGLIAADLPLCVVGDTLTLPNVMLQSGFRNAGWDFGKATIPE